MDDLISRAAAIEAMERAAYWNDAERKIREIPAVDAVPVEWLKQKTKHPDSYTQGSARWILDCWKREQDYVGKEAKA